MVEKWKVTFQGEIVVLTEDEAISKADSLKSTATAEETERVGIRVEYFPVDVTSASVSTEEKAGAAIEV